MKELIQTKLRISVILSCISLFLILLIFNFTRPVYHEELEDYKENEYPNWGEKKLGVHSLWSEGFYGEKVKISILDTGITESHPDFEAKIKPGFNAITPGLKPKDDNGHGTMITGIIVAQHNEIGIRGIAPFAEIYPVKVLDRFGYGKLEDVKKGIEWSIENNIDVINLSFAIKDDKELLKSTIKKATDAGVIVVSSVMNSNGGTAGFPASYNEVISVTAVDFQLHRQENSGVGKVDFSAPGVNVVSTSSDNSYEVTSGTSIATPFITGVIALLLEKGTDPKEILTTLKQHSKDIGYRGFDGTFGWGFVQF